MRIATLSLSLVSAVGFAAEPSPFPVVPDAEGDKFMVSATNPYVSSTGYSILKQGGNAIDAMVAMQMTSFSLLMDEMRLLQARHPTCSWKTASH